MDHQRSQVHIASLADAQQGGLAAGGVLPGHKSQPGRELPSVLERPGIADGSHERGRTQGADAGDLRKLAARFIVSVPVFDLGLELGDKPVQLPEVIQENGDELPEHPGQLVLGILQDQRHLLGDVTDPLGYDQSVLGQEAPDLVGLGGTRLHEPLARAVQRQYRLLLDRLHGHEPHVGPADGFADRLRIGAVVLVGLHVRLHELRRDELHGVTEGLQLARPVVRAAAGFHADEAGREVREEQRELGAFELFLQRRLTALIDAVHLEDVFSQVDANGYNIHVDVPHLL